MSIFSRILSGGRIRKARKALASNRTVRNYAKLAREHACLGHMDDVARICGEGLRAFPGEAELIRLASRAQQMRRETRTRRLVKDLRRSPKPAIWRELCSIMFESEKLARVEEYAEQWFSATKDYEALMFRARARAQRFLSDRRRDDGRFAYQLLALAHKLKPQENASYELRLHLSTKIGAWGDARGVVARLLKLNPGDANLQTSYRSLLSMGEEVPSVDEALREVERSGRLVGEEENTQPEHQGDTEVVGQTLDKLAGEEGINAVVAIQGTEVNVRGTMAQPAVQEVVQSAVDVGRKFARRIGIGNVEGVTIEGDFGVLNVAADEHASGGVWSAAPIKVSQERELVSLLKSQDNYVEVLS